MSNYIKINRKILDWEWWYDINTHRLFLYMLIKANWKDGKYKGIDVPRGSLASCIPKLSQDTSLTPDEVRTAIKHLKSTNEISSKSYNKFTIFTINNYNLYQDSSEQITSCESVESKNNNTETENKSKNVKRSRSKNTEDNIELFNRLLPDYSISDVLADKVKEWILYKISKKEIYVERGMKSLLKVISKYSHSNGDFAVMDLIDICISNNWKGIIWDKLEPQNNGKENIVNEWRNA